MGHLTRIADGKIVVVYNAAYDRRLLIQSASRLSMPEPLLPVRWECAMLKHAEWVGEWNDYHGSFRWQKLVGGDHSALGDCIARWRRSRKWLKAGSESWINLTKSISSKRSKN